MRPTTRSAARLAAPVLALVVTLALAGCGGRMSGAAPTSPAATTATPVASATAGTTGTTDPATATATPPAGVVVDQDTLQQITGVLDDTERVLDAVDQEIAADPQE